MGYNLYIGELTTEIDPEPGEHVYCRFGVITEGDDNSPLNSSDLRLNECWPSYTGWHNFACRAGLEDVFFKEYEGILVQHPGAYVLTKENLDRFETAKKEYIDSGDPEIDVWDRRRLDWLCYWTKWALENCKVPVFVNS